MKRILRCLMAILSVVAISAGCTNAPDEHDYLSDDSPQLFGSLSEIKPIHEKKPDSEMLFIQAMNAYDAGKLNEALSKLDDVLALNPDFTLAWFNKSFILIEQERYKEANECCDKAIAHRPNYAPVWINKGVALINLKLYSEAVGASDKAIPLAPKNPDPLINKGIALWKLNRLRQAIKALDLALELDKNHAKAWFVKAICHVGMKQEPLALQSMEQAVKLDQHYLDEINREPILKKLWDSHHIKE